jgi:hypothetical protein
MSDIDLVLDAEIAEAMDHSAAERLDKRIRLLVGSIGDSLDKLHTLVDEAKRGEIHQALGFPSWPAYLADAFTIQVKLGREHRRELVAYLSGEGVSQRVITDVVGADRKTVRKDLAEHQVGETGPPDSKPVTGRDGKTYQPPKPKPQEPSSPQRKPITDTATSISLDLARINKRIAGLVDDDRFGRHRDAIGNSIRPGVDHGLKILARIDREINGPKESVAYRQGASDDWMAPDKLSALVGVLQTCLEFAAGIHDSTADQEDDTQHRATILDLLDGIANLIDRETAA